MSRLPDHLRQLAQRVAQHEMGHYVVARALGFQTGEVSVEVIGPLLGHNAGSTITVPQNLATFDDLRTYLQRRILVLYAGGLAETLVFSAPEKRVNAQEAHGIIIAPDKGAKDDYTKIRELTHVLRNVSENPSDTKDDIATQAQLNAIGLKLWQRAIELVELHADVILGLAGNLAGRVTKTKEKFVLAADYLENLPGVKGISTVPLFADPVVSEE